MALLTELEAALIAEKACNEQALAAALHIRTRPTAGDSEDAEGLLILYAYDHSIIAHISLKTAGKTR